MASLLTNAGRLALLVDGTAWTAATYKAALVGPGYTPAVTDSAPSAFAGYELSGTGYASGYGGSGRKTLASKTATNDAQGRTVLDAADLTWTSIDAGTVAYVAILRETGGTDAASVLLAVLDFPVTTTDGSNLAVTWPAAGVLRFD